MTLSPYDVRLIRSYARLGQSAAWIARTLGRHPRTVADVIRWRTHKRIAGPTTEQARAFLAEWQRLNDGKRFWRVEDDWSCTWTLVCSATH